MSPLRHRRPSPLQFPVIFDKEEGGKKLSTSKLDAAAAAAAVAKTPDDLKQSPRAKIFTISNNALVQRFVLTALAASLALVVCLAVLNDLRPSTTSSSNGHLLLAVSAHQTAPASGRHGAGHGTTSAPSRRTYRRAVDGAGESIDRFDLGEQIRPPLLRAPTTLAPARWPRAEPPGGESAAAAAAANSQDSSYMSPEEHEQLVRSQDAHYAGQEGGGPGEQGGGPMAVGQSEASGSPSGQSAEQRAGPGNGLDQDDSQSDDDDSESGGEQPADPRQMQRGRGAPEQVPETRRQLAVGGHSHQHQQQQQHRYSPAAEDDRPAADDYTDGRGNEAPNQDAYFSRKPAVEQRLSEAASYNRQQAQQQAQHRQMMADRRQQRQNGELSAGPNGGPESAAPPTRDIAGNFGPNEAYLAERAEAGGSGANRLDLEDDPEDGADPDDGPPAAMADEPQQQQQQQELQSNEGPQMAPPSTSYSGQPGQLDSMSAADQPPGGGNSEPNSDNYAAAASSSAGHTGFALSRLPATPGPRQDTPSEAHEKRARQQAVAEAWHQQRLRNNPHLLASGGVSTHAPLEMRAPNRQQWVPHAQATTTQAPYNPQNNPSHAGKYFIN